MPKLKCIESYNREHYEAGEEFIIENIALDYVTIEVNKNWTYNKTSKVRIKCSECIDEKNNIYKSSEGIFQIIEYCRIEGNKRIEI